MMHAHDRRTSAERAAARIAMALLVALLITAGRSSAVLGQTPQARAVSDRNGIGSPKQAVALDGTWIDWVKEVSVVQTGRPGGGVNAQVSVDPRYAPPFQQWLAHGGLKDGSLTFFTPDFKTPVLIVKLSGLHIQSIADDVTANSQNIPRSTITMSFTGLSISQRTARGVVAP